MLDSISIIFSSWIPTHRLLRKHRPRHFFPIDMHDFGSGAEKALASGYRNDCHTCWHLLKEAVWFQGNIHLRKETLTRCNKMLQNKCGHAVVPKSIFPCHNMNVNVITKSSAFLKKCWQVWGTYLCPLPALILKHHRSPLFFFLMAL